MSDKQLPPLTDCTKIAACGGADFLCKAENHRVDLRKCYTEATRPQDSSWYAGFTGSVPDVIGNARKRGAVDYVHGVVVGDNPYIEHDARHWAWAEGWAGAGLATHWAQNGCP